MSSNGSDGHIGFMQTIKVPQSCKRWIWIPEALSNTNPSKKLTVPIQPAGDVSCEGSTYLGCE